MSDRAISILVHGGAKVGKTTFTTTAPAPRLLLDVESASRFLQVKKVKWNIDAGDPPPVDDGTWDTCIVHINNFDTALKAYEWLKSGQHPFKSVILDSISELQAKAQESVNGRARMQTQHWGDLLAKISFFCRDLRDLTTHPSNPIEAVVITAMSKDVDGVLKPLLQGSVASQIPYWFDITSYLFVDQEANPDTGEIQTVRKLLTAKHPEYEAGNRVPNLEPILVAPNIESMLESVFGPRD